MSKLVEGAKKHKSAGYKEVNYDCEERLTEMALNQDNLETSAYKWRPVRAGGVEYWFLIIKLHKLELSIRGDFKMAFETTGPRTKFYFW